MTKTSKDNAKSYYQKVKKKGTIYVWGMNYPTIITKESIEKAYRDNGTEKYNKSYYTNKLNEGKGKPGSDCSGMHYGLSGYDTTAQGYYKRCETRGNFASMPIDDIVLLFKGESASDITHTGVYLGNGLCIHMKSSLANCVQESVDKHGWTHWGRPDFIDYNTVLKAAKPVLTRELLNACIGVDVKFLQTLLRSKGYDCGKVDGDFGGKTEKAVLKFQNDNRLTVDGIVGKNTAKKLGFKWGGA